MAQSVSDRHDGVPRPQRRRRWIAVLALLGLLLAIVVSTVWFVDRPLTDVEQRLVGTWRNTTNPAVFTFHSDRTVTGGRFPPGTWQMRENKLYTADSLIEAALLRTQVSELTFEDDNSISAAVNGVTQKWQRVNAR